VRGVGLVSPCWGNSSLFLLVLFLAFARLENIPQNDRQTMPRYHKSFLPLSADLFLLPFFSPPRLCGLGDFSGRPCFHPSPNHTTPLFLLLPAILFAVTGFGEHGRASQVGPSQPSFETSKAPLPKYTGRCRHG